MLRRELRCGWMIAVATYALALLAWLTPLLAGSGHLPATC